MDGNARDAGEKEEDHDKGMVLVEEKEADGGTIAAPLPVCVSVWVCMHGVPAEEEDEGDKEKGRVVVLVPAEAKEEEESIPSILPVLVSAEKKEGEEGSTLLSILRIAKASRREGMLPEEEKEEEGEGTTSILPCLSTFFAAGTLAGFLCL